MLLHHDPHIEVYDTALEPLWRASWEHPALLVEGELEWHARPH